MKYLEENKFYMEIHTGSVAGGKEWETDFEDETSLSWNPPSWSEWGGESLIEVEKINGEWVEVK